MNKDNAKDYLPLVQALAEGRVIQGNCGGEWKDDDYPSFSSPPNYYRIKPEPREVWVNEYPSGVQYVWSNETQARENVGEAGITRRYREVIE